LIYEAVGNVLLLLVAPLLLGVSAAGLLRLRRAGGAV
jgi:hypothetical protein